MYKASVKRDLKKLSRSDARRVLDQIENELAADPKKCLSLKGQFTGLRKYRVGEYRVIFALTETEVLILRVAHRKDVYQG